LAHVDSEDNSSDEASTLVDAQFKKWNIAVIVLPPLDSSAWISL
jgi:hypothetical protein